jgi:hypothetical protein
MQTAIKPRKTLSAEDVEAFQMLVAMTSEQFEGMSPVERAGFSIRKSVNELVYTFLTARGFNIDRVKDRRGKEELLPADDDTERAACLLLLNVVS